MTQKLTFVYPNLPKPNVYWLHMDGMVGFNDPQTALKNDLTERRFVINKGAKLEVDYTYISYPISPGNVLCFSQENTNIGHIFFVKYTAYLIFLQDLKSLIYKIFDLGILYLTLLKYLFRFRRLHKLKN
jgi:hypothetical protein